VFLSTSLHAYIDTVLAQGVSCGRFIPNMADLGNVYLST
jgi:hypothetical protein